jgi:hypothetical protein
MSAPENATLNIQCDPTLQSLTEQTLAEARAIANDPTLTPRQKQAQIRATLNDPVLTYQHRKALFKAVLTSALFDLAASDKVYQEKGIDTYRRYQRRKENVTLRPGVAYPLVRRLLRLNDGYQEADALVEVVLLSRNDPVLRLRRDGARRPARHVGAAGRAPGSPRTQSLADADRARAVRRWANAELPPSFSQPASSIWEGLVAKRRDSRYEPGLRSGAWQKMRVYQGQQFVIGGYTIGSRCFDALIFGYYDGDRLIYRANQKRLHTGRPAEGVRETAPARNHRMPVHQSAGSQERAVGPGADRGKDEGMSLGEAGARRSVRVSRMDWREPPAAHEVHRTEERQGCKDGAARITTQRRRTVMARNRHDRGAAAGTERKEGAAMMIVFNDGNGDRIVDAERQQIQDVGSGSV